MEFVTITLYNFDEMLIEDQQKVVENYLDINVDHAWWEFIYDDYKEDRGKKGIKLKCNAFDINKNLIGTEVIEYTDECLEALELTHKELKHLKGLLKQFSINDFVMDTFEDHPRIEDLREKVEIDLRYYEHNISRKMLETLYAEYEHLTSYEAIAETLKMNEYLFDLKTHMIYSK